MWPWQKTEQKLSSSPFQTMEIRKLMLQIRRTSHRNSFYGSGKMLHCDSLFSPPYIHILLSMCVKPAVCGHVFVQLDHRKATSLPHHHPFGLFLGGSQAPVWNGLSPVSTQNCFLLHRICILWCVSTIPTRQRSISLDWRSNDQKLFLKNPNWAHIGLSSVRGQLASWLKMMFGDNTASMQSSWVLVMELV